MKDHKVFPGGTPLSGLDKQSACLILVSNYTDGVSFCRATDEESSEWLIAGSPAGAYLSRGFWWLWEAGMIEYSRPEQARTAVRLTHKGRVELRHLFPKADLILP